MLAILPMGCGYSTRSLLPSNIRTVYVEPFKNSVDFTADQERYLYSPLMEVDIRNAIINRFLFDGTLKIGELETADLVLKGELVNYDKTVLRYTENDDVEEFRIHVTVNLTMWDSQKQEVFWQENGFTGEEEYFITGPKAISDSAALELAVKDLARRVVERTIEHW